MTDRLKNTILCSLLLAGKYIVALLFTELLTAAAMYVLRGSFDFTVGTEALPLMLTMLSGMSFFERHNAFCAANAVSERNRIISAGTAAAVICLLVSAAGCIVWAVSGGMRLSFTELMRTAAHMRMISGGSFFTDGTELFFFAAALFFFGYFLGGIRYLKGGAPAMAILALLAAVSAGSVFLESFTDFTPAMVLLYVPALMQRSVFTAVLLNIILAAAFFALSVRISEVTVEKRRGG